MSASGFTVRISDDADDPAWDDFLESTPLGSFRQSARWGAVREVLGWRPARVVVSESGHVVAGVQMETKRLPFGGSAGIVRRAPVMADQRPELIGLVLDELLAAAKARRVRYLVVQPPPGCELLTAELRRRGFRHGGLDALETQETASVRVDLGPDVDTVFARMDRKCRDNIRFAQKHGITVRRGAEADLPVFDRLKEAHSARLGYLRRGPDYYTGLWRELGPAGHVALLISEYEGEPLAAILAVRFGDTSYHRERPWSGEHGRLRPNELLEWEAMKWAKSEGLRFANLGAIEPHVADAVIAGARETIDLRYSASRFKLKFGGEIVVDPPFMDYVFNPVLRLAYRSVPRSVLKSDWAKRLTSRLQSTGS
jgi:peptidoglycan pentaglycine glycine transferase (the first glycine)